MVVSASLHCPPSSARHEHLLLSSASPSSSPILSTPLHSSPLSPLRPFHRYSTPFHSIPFHLVSVCHHTPLSSRFHTHLISYHPILSHHIAMSLLAEPPPRSAPTAISNPIINNTNNHNATSTALSSPSTKTLGTYASYTASSSSPSSPSSTSVRGVLHPSSLTSPPSSSSSLSLSSYVSYLSSLAAVPPSLLEKRAHTDPYRPIMELEQGVVFRDHTGKSVHNHTHSHSYSHSATVTFTLHLQHGIHSMFNNTHSNMHDAIVTDICVCWHWSYYMCVRVDSYRSVNGYVVRPSLRQIQETEGQWRWHETPCDSMQGSLLILENKI